ncbi:glycine cleavage system aminomethyltransferase GcvT [Actinomycetaceae bacterium L2_0104]
MVESLQTPLHGVHIELGATLTDFAGWQMPLRYSSDRAEHEAVRTRAGIFDLSHMAQIEVEGPLAGECLDAALVNTPSAMPVGRARYSLLLNAEGGILDDLIVYRLAELSFLVVANAANRLLVRDELTARSLAYCEARAVECRVSVTDTTLHRSMIAIQGPRSVEIVEELLGGGASGIGGLGYYRITQLHVDTVPVRVARTGYTGEVGYELMIPASAAVALWKRALDVGERHGLRPCGLAARDSLRLEAGMPLYGHELTPETAPADVGLARVVKDHRFVGEQALAGRPQQWQLYGLTGQGRRAARAGCVVHIDGQEAGAVTSGILSPTLGYPIALARMRPGITKGTDVSVDVRGKFLPMKVVELPFYTRDT